MNRNDLIINKLVDDGLLDEILDLYLDDVASPQVKAQFIVDIIDSVTANAILDELSAYYGKND